MFWLRNKKTIFWYALLTKVLSVRLLLFVCVLRPSQQFFGHAAIFFCLLGLNKY